MNKKEILMSKKVASMWLEGKRNSYHQVTIYNKDKSSKRIADLLRSARDNKIRIAKLDPIPDLGITEKFDGVTLSSSNQKALEKLALWFEGNGYMTTGVW